MESLILSGVEYDFEKYVKSNVLPPLDPADDPSKQHERGHGKFDPKFRTIVCTHWLLGLCSMGKECKHLHRLDKSKMPPCKHGTLCKIKNCPQKHGDKDTTECVFFKQGFCYNGPVCQRRHVSRPPDECPEEASFELGYINILNSAASTQGGANANKRQRTHTPNENYKVTLCTHWLISGNCQYGDGCHFAHGEDEVQGGQQSGIINSMHEYYYFVDMSHSLC
jgi:hypothetical protein